MTACASLNDAWKNRLHHLLVEQSIDWWKLFELATWHGTCPLIARLLGEFQDIVPADVWSRFREKANSTAKKNVLFAAELIKLKALLDGNGIEFISYKGLPLSLQAFGNLDCREFSDIDIIVDRARVTDVQKILLDANFSMEPADRILSNDFIYSSLFRKLAFEQTFSRRPQGDVVATSVIDVHWEVAPPYVISFDFATLKTGTIEMELFGRPIRTFKPELSIVLLCCHGTKHEWSRLRWIVDIASIIQAHPNLNWQEVYETAREFGLASKVDLALMLCGELPQYQLNLPEAVASRLLVAQNKLAPLAEQTVKSWFQPDSQKINLRLYWHYELSTFDTFERRANFLLHELCAPDLPTYLGHPLPESLYGLYHIIHPLRLTAGFIRARLPALAFNERQQVSSTACGAAALAQHVST